MKEEMLAEALLVAMKLLKEKGDIKVLEEKVKALDKEVGGLLIRIEAMEDKNE